MIAWIQNYFPSISIGSISAIGLFIFFFKKPLEDWWKPYGDWVVEKLLGRIPAPPQQKSIDTKMRDDDSKEPKEIVETERDESPIVLLGLNPPDYRKEYREDVIEKILWRWSWKDGATETPNIYCIEKFEYFCPKCGMRINTELRTHIARGPLRENYTQFHCDKCSFDSWQEGNVESVKDKVSRFVEHNAHDPKEWQAAPERIRAAREDQHPGTIPSEPTILTLPDESQGIRWRCKWEGNRITKMDPVCPNPNCGQNLRITQAGGQYGSDAVFVCDSGGCGFKLRFEDIPAVVVADSRRDLEGQAVGRPPMPPKERQNRIWTGYRPW